MKRIIKICFFVFLLVLLSACVKPGDKSHYTLTYSVSGNGYIECEYLSGASIEKDTYVNLVAKGNGKFEGWYKDGAFYDEGSDLLIILKSDVNLEAKFTGTNYKEETFTLIKDVKDGENAKVCATVVAIHDRGYLLKDSSGYMMVYLGSNAKVDYKVNDVIVISGVASDYEGKAQFSSSNTSYKVDVSKETLQIEEVDNEYLYGYLSNIDYGKYVSFNASLSSQVNSGKTYYNLYPLGSDLCVYTYYPSSAMMNVYNGQNCTASGFLWALYGRLYLVVTEINEFSGTVEDYSSKLKVLYTDSFKDVNVSFSGGPKKEMILVDGYYEIDIPARADIVKFYSGSESTVEFDFDQQFNVFVVGEKNFQGKYSGYFTTIDAVANDVKKITSLSMNDVHGYIMQDNNGRGGMSNASYIANQIRNENNDDDVILVANGDMFQGTAVSNTTKGLAVIDAMSKMGFDFLGVGNHEFDWGIEEIFKYFDNDLENGEANFPLVNSNIVYSEDSKLVIYENSNMHQSLMLEKNGLKIGVISCVGDVYSSILYSRVRDYLFESTVKVTEELAKSLKDQGADIILVNIHDGDSSGVSKYNPNNQLAQLKYNGKNLIDVVINGHTHTRQLGYIERSGADMPVIQCGGNGQNIGEIELYYDTVKEELVSSFACHYDITSVANTNYDEKVEEVIDKHYNAVKYLIDEVYCVSNETINSKEQLYEWSANVMLSAVGADIGISNNGGLRSTGDIYYGNNITLENLYLINPFDNEIMLVEVPGYVIANFLRSSAIYYDIRDGLTLSQIQSDSDKYKVAVIDYVYYWNNFPSQYETVNTEVIFRDAMIEDLRLRDVFNPSTDNNALVGNLYNPNN